MTTPIIRKAAEEFASRAGLSENALGGLKRYEGYLSESLAVLAFVDICRTDFGFKWQAIAKAVNRDHSTLIKNMQKHPDGPHMDTFSDLATDCITNALKSL